MLQLLNIIIPKKKVTFLYKAEKTKTKHPVKFATKDGDVEFNAKRKPQRRSRVEFRAKNSCSHTILYFISSMNKKYLTKMQQILQQIFFFQRVLIQMFQNNQIE